MTTNLTLNTSTQSNRNHSNNLFSIFQTRSDDSHLQSNNRLNIRYPFHSFPSPLVSPQGDPISNFNCGYHFNPNSSSTLAHRSNTSYWTKYCLLCILSGTITILLSIIYLILTILIRYYTNSTWYFETIPSYIPAILLSIVGISTIAFSCKRNRNIILLRLTTIWSLLSASVSSIITITTSLIHMNRLQTLKECVYNSIPLPSCTCFGSSYTIETGDGPMFSEPAHYVFENTANCDVIHGVLYSCLRTIFAISVITVLLSIFLCMLLYQLIGHERKKAYWQRIRRINSEWNTNSTDLLSAYLARPQQLPRDNTSLLPLIISNSISMGSFSGNTALESGLPGSLPSQFQLRSQSQNNFQLLEMGPPPPYTSSTATSPITAELPTNSLVTTPASNPNQFIIQRPENTSIANSSAHPFSPTLISLNNATELSTPPGPSNRNIVHSDDDNSNYNINSNSNAIIHLSRLRESKISILSDNDDMDSSLMDESIHSDRLLPFQNKLVNIELDKLNSNVNNSEVHANNDNSTQLFNNVKSMLNTECNSLPCSPYLNDNMNLNKRKLINNSSPIKGNRHCSAKAKMISSNKISISLPTSPNKSVN